MTAPPDAYPGVPRWVKITGIVVLVVLVVGILAAVILGGDHGPSRHM